MPLEKGAKRKPRKRATGVGPGPGGPSLNARTATIQPAPRILTDFGIPSIPEFNRRLQAGVRAHETAFNKRPSASLAFDLVRVGLADHEYERLFDVVASPQRVRTRKALNAPLPEGLAEDVMGAFGAGAPLARGERFPESEFSVPSGKLTVNLLADEYERATGRAPLGRRVPDPRDQKFWEIRNRLQKAGVLAEPRRLFFEQLADAITGIPEGVKVLGTAWVMDLRDVGSEALRHTAIRGLRSAGVDVNLKEREIGLDKTYPLLKGMVSATVDQWSNPKENPGYIFLDVITLGAGKALIAPGKVAQQVVTAARGAEGAGATVKAIGRVIVTPPPHPGVYEFGAHGVTVERALSRNWVRAAIQQQRAAAGSEKLSRRLGDSGTGRNLIGDLDLLGRLTPERRLGKEILRDMRYFYDEMTAPSREMNRLARWEIGRQFTLEDVRKRHLLPKRAAGRVAWEKALDLWRTGLADEAIPVARGHHERIIAQMDQFEAKYGPHPDISHIRDSHQAHLDAIKIAEPVYNQALVDAAAGKPSRFLKLARASERASEAATHAKSSYLGLNPYAAERVIAQHVSTLRGEGVVGAIERAHLNAVLEDVNAVSAKIIRMETALAEGTPYVHRLGDDIRELDPVELRDRLDAEYEYLEKLRADALHWDEAAWAALPARLENAFHVPDIRSMYSQAARAPEGLPSRRVGRFGVGPGRPLTEIHQHNTGKAMWIGDVRFDVTTLIANNLARAARAATTVMTLEKLYKLGRKTNKPRPGEIPVRNIDAVRPELRRVMQDIDDGTFRNGTLDALTDDEFKRILDTLVPAEMVGGNRRLRFRRPDENLDDVVWVDERLVVEALGGRWKPLWDLMDRWMRESRPGIVLSGVNMVFRDLTLFLRPAYALNMLGAAAMTMINEGPLQPVYLGRALGARWFYGDDAGKALDHEAGMTRPQSFLSAKTPVTKSSEMLIRMWQPITDLFFRRAQMLYELAAAGFTDKAGIRRALGLEGELTAAERVAVRAARDRTRKSMIDFELNAFEKAVLRHVFFIYAFQSRSIVWSIHTMVEHPIVVDAMVKAGQAGEEGINDLLAMPPDWFARMGLLQAGFDEDGNPMVQNFNQLSTFGTFAEAIHVAEGLIGKHDPYASLDEFGGPLAEFFVRAFTGRGEFGEELEGPTGVAALLEVLNDTPIGAVLRRRKQLAESEADPGIDFSSDIALITLENRLREQETFIVNGWQDVYLPTIFGGLIKRSVNEAALNARGWREQTGDALLEHQRDLIKQHMDENQAPLLGLKRAPDEVVAAAQLSFELAKVKREFLTRTKMPINPLNEGLAMLRIASGLGLVTAAERRQVEALLYKAEPGRDIEDLVETIRLEYGGGKELERWHERINKVLKVSRGPGLGQAITLLAGKGVLPADGVRNLANVSQATLDKVGRAYAAWVEQMDDLEGADEVVAMVATDKPLKIDGLTFPSPERIDFGLLTTEAANRKIASLVNADYADLTPFERELFGRKPKPGVQNGWVAYHAALQEWRDENPGRNITAETRTEIAQTIGRAHDGFYQDFLFSEQPLYRRFEMSSVYQRSENRSLWGELIEQARVFEQARNSGRYLKREIDVAWSTYIEETLLPYVGEQGGSWADEIDSLGETFLRGMIK